MSALHSAASHILGPALASLLSSLLIRHDPTLHCLSVVPRKLPSVVLRDMRLLDTITGQFIHANSPREAGYAILSHTWDAEGEQTYQDIRAIQESWSTHLSMAPISTAPPTTVWSRLRSLLSHFFKTPLDLLKELFGRGKSTPGSPEPQHRTFWDDPRLSPKVKNACMTAAEYGYRWIWMDMCCIDKTSSAELSEAINSMFAWYRDAHLCLVYMADVPSDHGELAAQDSPFRKSKWFQRGWTLQELLGPSAIIFFSQDWKPLGTKFSLSDVLTEVTGVEYEILHHLSDFQAVSIAKRLSWAAERKTTRVEDEAYSLMGLFDINMPTLYGEGRRAFRRLQEEILKRHPNDQSLLVWDASGHFPDVYETEITRVIPAVGSGPFRGFFATSPSAFKNSRDVKSIDHSDMLRLLGLKDAPAPTFAPTSFGTVQPFPIIPIGEYYPPGTVFECLRIANPYFLVLSCVYNDKLLAMVCAMEDTPEGSGEQHHCTLSTRGSVAMLRRGEPGDELVSFCTHYVALSPAIISSQRCRDAIRVQLMSGCNWPSHQASRSSLSTLPVAGLDMAPWSYKLLLESGCEELIYTSGQCVRGPCTLLTFIYDGSTRFTIGIRSEKECGRGPAQLPPGWFSIRLVNILIHIEHPDGSTIDVPADQWVYNNPLTMWLLGPPDGESETSGSGHTAPHSLYMTSHHTPTVITLTDLADNVLSLQFNAAVLNRRLYVEMHIARRGRSAEAGTPGLQLWKDIVTPQEPPNESPSVMSDVLRFMSKVKLQPLVYAPRAQLAGPDPTPKGVDQEVAPDALSQEDSDSDDEATATVASSTVDESDGVIYLLRF